MTERDTAPVWEAPHIQALEILLSDNAEVGTVIEGIRNPDDLDRIESGIVTSYSDKLTEEGNGHQFCIIPKRSLSFALLKQLPKDFIGPTKNYKITIVPPDLRVPKGEDNVDWDNTVAFEVSRDLYSRGKYMSSVKSLCMYYTRNKQQGIYAPIRPYLYRSVTSNEFDQLVANRIVSDSSSRAYASRSSPKGTSGRVVPSPGQQ